MKYTTNNIRNMFLKFFSENKHAIVPSSSLIPKKKTNLLFTNAGMNQFQDIFLEKKKYTHSTVTTIQKCLRTGGKHNDLEQVGCSDYHNTFFEMLGNFSFGKYFKKEAIVYAWTLLTDVNWFNISKNKLFVTVYIDDIETYNIWRDIIKISKDNIIKIGDKKKKYESDNFWQMGDIGPCGPCTEIFFKNVEKKINIHDLSNKKICLEIWNIVFIQFNRINENTIIPLSSVFVDTGMGLERIASVLQNVKSNYETDVFKKIIQNICKTNNIKNKKHKSLNVIADHIRAAIFIIHDNVLPSNENRGYILRRIIRRALRHGIKLGIKNIFFYKLVTNVISIIDIKDIDLKNKTNYIENIIKQEELQFIKTLNYGLKLLKKKIKQSHKYPIDENTIFYLYDTLGFPIDLTKEIFNENNIIFDENKLNRIILNNKKNNKKLSNHININIFNKNSESEFKGYTKNKTISIIKNIFINNQPKKKIIENETGIIILDKTPFFGESGGQKGDSGIIYHNESIFDVIDTQIFFNTILHIGKIRVGEIKVNHIVKTNIDLKKRINIQNNHSGTHLLNYTLKKLLKSSIQQKGSYINEKYFRFDFSYYQDINTEQIKKIENTINKYIQDNIEINTNYLTLQEAKLKNFVCLNNKQYPNIVRSVSIGNFSNELCKGTHSIRTGNLGIFKIIKNKNIAFGIRRIEAVTGMQAIKKIQKNIQYIKEIKLLLKTNIIDIVPKIKKLINTCDYLKKKNTILIKENIKYYKNKIIKNAVKIKNTNFIFNEIKKNKSKTLKILIDNIKQKIQSGIVILFYQNKKKNIFIASVTKDLIKKITAKDIINVIKKKTSGSGGGTNNIAECIGNNNIEISKIIQHMKLWIASKI
ncbi:alanine--tRNA ligase [Buchnera aphidicola]|uniref:alanine--tRNA ligase n=1 Tax=Buchnera aphidicola TaxID=9 RepID=UPI0034648946